MGRSFSERLKLHKLLADITVVGAAKTQNLPEHNQQGEIFVEVF